jgi:hypothetical protein
VSLFGIQIQGKIHATGFSTFNATNCTFRPLSEERAAIEFLCESHGKFENCVFENSENCAVIVRDRSKAVFEGCTFRNCLRGVIATEKAVIEFNNCTFEDIAEYAVYVHSGSETVIKNCRFQSLSSRAVLCLKASFVTIEDATFSNVSRGLIIANASKGSISRSTLEGIGPFGCHAASGSNLDISQCTFTDLTGNALFYLNSTGRVDDIEVTNFSYPALVANGTDCTPDFNNCRLTGGSYLAVASRDSSHPTFTKMAISDIQSDVFSISDGSAVIINDCTVKRCKNSVFAVFNEAKAIVTDTAVEECGSLSNCFLGGEIEYLFGTPVCDATSGTEQVHHTEYGSSSCDHKCPCGQEAEFACVPCGHRVCSACGQVAKGGLCPLCSSKCTDFVHVFDSCEKCVVCMEEDPTWIVLGCGHKCLCAECAPQMLNGNTKCPLCGILFVSLKKDYSLTLE